MVVLNQEEIKKLILEEELIREYIDLDIQLTPNGFDFTVEKIFKFKGEGAVDFSNTERVLPPTEELPFMEPIPPDKRAWWWLPKGVYKVRTNEVVNLPIDLIALAFPRSSLLRMGVYTHNAVWDAGFKGRSEFLLVVENSQGVKIKQNARLIQVIFIRINKPSYGYQGIYQNYK
ncbi:MAG: deoxyuridine 5'-triphosphate nucleotidohydrolase [Candidatus Omnitrophota bacterium]|nr:MAG: deoxyuridine 5'-triphosphate nucleotidohydrolase [Candidatus Omnitrophota bacterium]